MIGKLIPGTCDVVGKRVHAPSKKKHSFFRPTYPIGRYVTSDLQHRFSNLEQVRQFLSGCRYQPDRPESAWIPPDEFEHIRTGDQYSFALWAWRQVLAMFGGARFVTGFTSPRGARHAWVVYEREGEHYLLDPLRAGLSRTMPRFTTLRYQPKLSVALAGEAVTFYEHEELPGANRLGNTLPYLPGWLLFWALHGPLLADMWVSYVVGRSLGAGSSTRSDARRS